MKQALLAVLVLLCVGCSTSALTLSGASPIDWTYQEGERRLNFKNVSITSSQGRRVIKGKVENVGEEHWPNPTVTFVLLNRNLRVIDTASTQRTKPLNVGTTWNFTVRHDKITNFHRARFRTPTGW